MSVNESGSNHETSAVHRFGVRYNRDLSHCFDRVAANQDTGLLPRGTRFQSIEHYVRQGPLGRS